jgi:hypothetical protein
MRVLRIALLAAATACLVAATATAASSPAAQLTSMAKALGSHRSVHYVSVQKGGATSLTIVCDAGPTSGIQRITFRQDGRSGHVTVVVAKHTAYVRGDAFTLESFLGFTAADAKKFAGTWMLIPGSSHAYPTVAEDVTYDSAVDGLRPAGALANVAGRKLGGRRVVGVRGTTTASGQRVVDTLWLAARGQKIPVSRSIVAKSGQVTITFSDWGKRVNIHAPKGAIDPTKPAPSGVIA